MNERIKELLIKAGANENTIQVLKSNTYFDPEKFAELIVRECANAADMAQDAGCEYAGDYVAEYMGYGEAEGVTEWRAK